MKKLSIFLCIGLLVLTSGCGKSYKEYEKSVLQISKKDSIAETIYDTFDEAYYISDELKDSINVVSTTDELTGLFNRKYLHQRLEAELSRSKRYNISLSCLLLDIEYFGSIKE